MSILYYSNRCETKTFFLIKKIGQVEDSIDKKYQFVIVGCGHDLGALERDLAA